MNLIAHAFRLDNVIMHNRHYGVIAKEAIQRSDREGLHDPLEVMEWGGLAGALNGGLMNDGNLWFDYSEMDTNSLRDLGWLEPNNVCSGNNMTQ